MGGRGQIRPIMYISLYLLFYRKLCITVVYHQRRWVGMTFIILENGMQCMAWKLLMIFQQFALMLDLRCNNKTSCCQ